MAVVHEFGAWLFFGDTHLTPFAVFGASCVGWYVRGFVQWRRARKGKRDAVTA